MVGNYSRRRVSARTDHSGCGDHRDGRHRPRYRNHLYDYLCIGVLAVGLCSSAVAEENVTAIAAPSASSSGSVQNQAVQINQGTMGEQSFGTGHACQTPVMTFTPFFLGNDVRPKNYVRNQNYGAQISITVPLDGGMQELCKALAKEKVAKEKLRYELERLKNCAEVLAKGFTFHRDSPFWVLCGDVVPVASKPQP